MVSAAPPKEEAAIRGHAARGPRVNFTSARTTYRQYTGEGMQREWVSHRFHGDVRRERDTDDRPGDTPKLNYLWEAHPTVQASQLSQTNFRDVGER